MSMILVIAFTKNFVSSSHKRLYGQEKLYMPYKVSIFSIALLLKLSNTKQILDTPY